MAHQQCQFDVKPFPIDRAAAASQSPANAVNDGVVVHPEMLGGLFVAAASAKENPQGFTQSCVVVGIDGKVTEHLGYPVARAADVAGQKRGRRQTGIRRGEDGSLVLVACRRHSDSCKRLPMRPPESVNTGSHRAEPDIGCMRTSACEPTDFLDRFRGSGTER